MGCRSRRSRRRRQHGVADLARSPVHDHQACQNVGVAGGAPLRLWRCRSCPGVQAGLPRLHPHQLHRTFAHAWLAQGGGETDLMRLAAWGTRRCSAATALSRRPRPRRASAPLTRRSTLAGNEAWVKP